MPIGALNRLLGHVLPPPADGLPLLRRPPGSAALRRSIAQRGTDAGYAVGADDIVITSGAKEAVYLSIKAVTRGRGHGGHRIPGLLRPARGARFARAAGPRDPLPPPARDQPGRVWPGPGRPIAAVALVSNFSNPTGACMSDAAKRQLVELLERTTCPSSRTTSTASSSSRAPGPRPSRPSTSGGASCTARPTARPCHRGSGWAGAIPGRYQDRVELLKLVVNQATAVAPQLALAAFLDSGRLRPPHPAGPADVPGPDGVDDRGRGALLPRTDPADPAGGGHTSCGCSSPPGSTPWTCTRRPRPPGSGSPRGRCSRPPGGYRNFIRLNTGFPWSATTDAADGHPGAPGRGPVLRPLRPPRGTGTSVVGVGPDGAAHGAPGCGRPKIPRHLFGAGGPSG